MPTMTVPEVRLPKLDLSQIDLPKLDLSQIDLPKLDLSQIDLPKLDLSRVDLPRELDDRLPRRRRTNPLPFALIGLAIVGAGIWLIAWSPVAPRLRAAVSDVRARLGFEPGPAETPASDEPLDEYDVDPLMFGEPEPVAASDSGPAFEPDRSVLEEERVATLGS
jgi:hypothetical protein